MSHHPSPLSRPPSHGSACEVCGPVALFDLPHGDGPRDFGRVGEDVAAAHLEDHGYTIVTRNWRSGTSELRGELDIVAVDTSGQTLVVAEVKTRRNAERFGGALAAVGPGQQRRIRRLAAHFLTTSLHRVDEIRFDLVAVDLLTSDVGRDGTLIHVARAW